MRELNRAPNIRAKVAIVGAGIAGSWLALKLARAGVDTLLIHYSDTDRGGSIGSSARSVGAINTSPIERSDFRKFMDELGQGQHNPSVVDLFLDYMPDELKELLTLAEFKNIKLGVALANGNAGSLLSRLHSLFKSSGGRMLDAWVTRIVADENMCRGVQYQRGETVGKVLAPAIVIASGGYTGLFNGSVKTNSYGAVIGHFLRAGGIVTNLEFIFKHGYGKPDLGALTPTEELPGAEVYDDDGVHVEWLERELYEGRGTANHLEAFKHWRRNKDKDFFIDLKFRNLCSKVQAFNKAIDGSTGDLIDAAVQDIVAICPATERAALEIKLRLWAVAAERIDYDRFNSIKAHFSTIESGEVFRVRQIAYFSMGGIAHVDCTTNLANVFVTGEAMHDFGAHRVGGLPWGLYLAAGRFIGERLAELARAGTLTEAADFDLINVDAKFDDAVLQEIRTGLYRHHEREFNVTDALRFIGWVRGKRRALRERGPVLDDAFAWLIVAEAIMQASLRRTESRGCFYRMDYPATAEEMSARLSFARYDAGADVVNAELIRAAELQDILFADFYADEYQVAEG